MEIHSAEHATKNGAWDTNSIAYIVSLLRKCGALHASLCSFQQHLALTRKEHLVDVRSFGHAVSSERKSLERLAALADPDSMLAGHAIRSTNLHFLLAVWHAARSCRGVVALSKRFFGEASKPTNQRRKGVLVDVVAQQGQEWIKVSTANERSLLFELARAGWPLDSDGDDEDGTRLAADGSLTTERLPHLSAERADQEKIDLVRVAEDLSRAASETKVRYKHPKVRFILARVVEGREPAIDKIIQDIRATGVSVVCNTSTPEICETADFTESETVLDNMAPSLLFNLTCTLNLDCTILLALVSDLSHLVVGPGFESHTAIKRQSAAEATSPLLPNDLYPALVSRRLICALPAVSRMREIVRTVGTRGERARAEIVMGEGSAAGLSPALLREALQAQSGHCVPSDLRLPIEVSGPVLLNELPPQAMALDSQLSEINRSVLFLGWAEGWTTMSSNRAVAKQIEQFFAAQEGEPEGPHIWVCSTARSLIGKETKNAI